MFLLMAAPYSHSLPQLTQEPVSSTSVNSADYSKMMRKARRLFTVPTDSRNFCYHLHPWLTGIWPGSIFRKRLPSFPSCLPCPGSGEFGVSPQPDADPPSPGTLGAAAAPGGPGHSRHLRALRWGGAGEPALPTGLSQRERAAGTSCSAKGNVGSLRGRKESPSSPRAGGGDPLRETSLEGSNTQLRWLLRGNKARP